MGGWWIWRDVTLCTPAVCASGAIVNPVANALFLIGLGAVFLIVAACTTRLRIILMLCGAYLVGFGHHILIAHADKVHLADSFYGAHR